MRFAEIELLGLADVIDTFGLEFTLGEVETDPSLSMDENFYNRIVMDEKPEFHEMIALKLKEETRLKEVRMEELRGLCKGKHLEAIYTTGLVYHKAPALFESYVTSDNEVEVLKLLDIVNAREAEELEAKTIAHGEKVDKICRETLGYITGLNALKGLTGLQIDEIQANFSEVESALRSQRPAKALGLISAITADGTLIKEEDKTKIVNFLTKKLTP